MALTAADVIADLDSRPRSAAVLADVRARLGRAGNEAQRDRAWRAFVRGIDGGRTLAQLARDDPNRLNGYRDLFAELDAACNRPPQQELAL